MLWFRSPIFSTSKESMIIISCLIMSLHFVKTFEKKKILQKFPEPWFNFKQIRIFFFILFHSLRPLIHSFHTFLRQSGQSPKELSKFKTVITIRHLVVHSSNKNITVANSIMKYT